MYFKRIEMNGFKSFAEKISIDFKEGVTCIVGPNGSGKSNISDAIRWVLGEQSIKTLRGGKMDEVIFTGTSSRRAKSMAEVTLEIDNTSRILPIDFKEVQIRRRLFRSGESEYSINGNKCRLKDIRELIMDTGIGVDGYSLIGQGKIEEIISEKPEDRRSVFEEAAGVSKYRAKKDEASRKLDRSTGNRDRLNDIISEIESRVEPLREQSQQAKEFVKLRDRNKHLEINIALKSIDNINNKNKNINEEFKNLENRLLELTKSKLSLDNSLAESRDKGRDLEDEANDLKDQLLEEEKIISDLKNRLDLDQERKKTAEKDKARLKEDLEEALAGVESEALKKNDLELSLDVLDKEYRQTKAVEKEKNRETDELRKQINKISRKVEDQKNLIISSHRELTEKNSEITSIKNLKDTLLMRKSRIEEDMEVSFGSDSTFQKSKEEKERKLIDLSESIELLKTNKEKLLEDEKKIQIEIARLKGMNDEIKQDIGEMLARQNTLVEMKESYEGYSSGIQHIMTSAPEGLSGVVAELINTSPEYEKAIEGALGNSMQDVIFKDMDAAKEAIAILKEDDAGRVTFISGEMTNSLDFDENDRETKRSFWSKLTSSFKNMFTEKTKENFDISLESLEGFVANAVDVVHFDGENEKVFQHLLHKHIIFDNFDNAYAAMGKLKDYKAVTLDGEYLVSSNEFSGGVFRDDMITAMKRKNEIVDLGIKLRKRQIERDDLENLLGKEEAKLTALLEERKEVNGAIRAGEIELSSIQAEAKSLSDKEKDLEDRKLRWETELADINIETDRSQKIVDDLVAESEDLKKKAKENEEAVMESEAISREMKGRLSKMNEELMQVKLDVAKFENKRKSDLANLKSIDAALNERERRAESKRLELAKIKEIEDTSSDKGEKTEALLKEKHLSKDVLENKIQKIDAERKELSVSSDRYNKAKTDTEQELDALKARKGDLDIVLAKQDVQVETYKQRLWDEFDISFAEANEEREADFAITSAQKENREIKSRMKALGDVNIGAIEEYEEVKERYEFYRTQRDDVSKAIETLQKIISETDRTIKREFKDTFVKIASEFEKTFAEIFEGGRGELALEDENDPLNSGIIIKAQPPGARLRSMSALSGGQKTMVAISLMFSILKTKPSPFCMLDEVEAALDDNNIKKFAKYLKTFDDIQFALVTHQKETMEHADVLYGVTMPERGVSKVLSLKLGEKETDDFAKKLN